MIGNENRLFHEVENETTPMCYFNTVYLVLWFTYTWFNVNVMLELTCHPIEYNSYSPIVMFSGTNVTIKQCKQYAVYEPSLFMLYMWIYVYEKKDNN